MNEVAVQLRVAGQTYRVVTSAGAEELSRLVERVEGALSSVTPNGRQPSPQAFVLAAITLAHELEEERTKRMELESRHRRVLSTLLERVDKVLSDTAELMPEPAAGKRTPSKTSRSDPR